MCYDRVNNALTFWIYNSECDMSDLIFVWTFEVSLSMLREIWAENLISTENYYFERDFSPSQWLRGLRCGSVIIRLLGVRFRIPLWARIFVSCECLLRYLRRADHTSRGALPTSVRRCVCSRDLKMRKSWPILGCSGTEKRNIISCAMTLSVEYEIYWGISNL